MQDTIPLPPEVKKRVDQWLNGPFDRKTKDTIRTLLATDTQTLIDSFYCDLSFGTGGLRNLMGVGTNRLNIYTIRLATQGLAHYLLKQHAGNQPLSTVIGFDSRHHSEEFAKEAARVLAGNGIRASVIKELRPTPFISFACRHHKANAAIMITASHNPAAYNGYKVYWEDGAQVVHPHDIGIVQEIEAIQDMASVKLVSLNHPLIEWIDNTLDQAYLEAICPLQHFAKQNHEQGASLQIAYTPLHGTGITLAPKALADWGFTSLREVPEQSAPNADFPTTPFPNPESLQALELGIRLLIDSQSDILIANDPDADRTGLVALHQGKPVIFNGNEIAALCTHYLCDVLTSQRTMPMHGAFITTIVTTELMKEIAASYGTSCFEVLTGFKYIGEKIHEWECSSAPYQFLFGAEESYGYLIGTHSRDKDAIVSSCLIAEMALHAKLQNKTLVDCLHHIYNTYGVFYDTQLSLNFKPGKTGAEEIKQLMQHLRQHPLTSIATLAVVYMEDYLEQTRTYLDARPVEPLALPSSDVLVFRLADNSRLIIRPSGTEPKLKIYASTRQKTFSSIEAGIQECSAKLHKLLEALKACLQRG